MVIINPGTGPVAGATVELADAAVRRFAADLRAPGRTVSEPERVASTGHEGRWTYRITVDGTDHEIEMPGVPLDRVRYLAEPGQNLFEYVRLYVDGNSWLWVNALVICVTGSDAASPDTASPADKEDSASG
jgi:hypothetical protein